MFRRSEMRAGGGWLMMSLFMSSCGGKTASSHVTPKTPTYAEAQGEQTPTRDAEGKCFSPGRFADILVVDMDPADRTDLESDLSNGVLVVKYDCDGLQVVRDCHGPGDYGFSSVSLKEQVIQLASADELRANLPISGGAMAAQFGGEISAGKSLDVGLAMVGKMRSARSVLGLGDLQGDCEGATHFVRGVTLGAFAMAAGTRGKMSSSAELFSFSSNAKSESQTFRAQKDGDLNACAGAQRLDPSPPDQCRALLRLELKELVPGKTTAAAVSIDVQDCPENMTRQAGKCVPSAPQKETICSASDLSRCQTQCDAGQISACGIAAGKLLTDGQIAEAVPFLTPACQAGSLLACHNLGFANYLGAGTPQNFERALHLFTQVCDGGEPVGCSGVGMLHEEGKGVPKSAEQAFSFYTLACNGGEMNYGCPFLGRLYETGAGVPRDRDKARALYDQSCQAVGQNGCLLLQRLDAAP